MTGNAGEDLERWWSSKNGLTGWTKGGPNRVLFFLSCEAEILKTEQNRSRCFSFLLL